MPYIVPQQSIRGAAIGMSRAAVVARLGKPTHVTQRANDLGSFTELQYDGLRVTLVRGGSVMQLESTSARDRTATGVGVGSTEATLRAGLSGERCVTESGIRHCSIGRFASGQRVTDFFLRGGRVWRVVVGRVTG